MWEVALRGSSPYWLVRARKRWPARPSPMCARPLPSTWSAASLPMALRGPGVTTVAMTTLLLSPARAGVSAPRAPRGAWQKRRHTCATTCFPVCRLGGRLAKPSHESLKVSLGGCHVAPRVLEKGTSSGLAAAPIPGKHHRHAPDAVVRYRNCTLRRK